MGSKRLNTFCCCCNVKTGAMIVGWLGVIAAVGSIIVYSNTMVNIETVYQALDTAKEEYQEAYQRGEISHEALEQICNFLDLAKHYVMEVLTAIVGHAVFELCIYGFLLVGVSKRKPVLMLPWMILNMIGLVIASLVVVGFFIFLMAAGLYGFGIIFLAIAVFVFGFGYYIWFVVHGAYGAVKEELLSMDRLPVILNEVPPSYEDVVVTTK